MKQRFQILFFLAVLLIFIAIPSASAQAIQPSPARPGPPLQPGRFAGDPIRQLNLTPEQAEQIRLIREQNREEGATINQRVRETNRALQEVLDADNPDEGAVEQRLREAAAAQGAAMRMRILRELKIRRVLTHEQRALLRTLQRQVDQVRQRRLEGSEDRVNRREQRTLRMRERPKNLRPLLPGRAPQRRPIL